MYGTGLLKGLRVTFRHFFKPPITVQFPEEVRNFPARARTSLLWFDERCTGCSTCAQACPDGCILVATEPRAGRLAGQGALRDRLPHLHVLRPLHRGLPVRGDPARRHLPRRRLLLRRHVPRQARAHAPGARAPAQQRLRLPQRHEGAEVGHRLHRRRGARRAMPPPNNTHAQIPRSPEARHEDGPDDRG